VPVIYAKSALAGLASVLLFCGLLPVLITIVRHVVFFVRASGEGGIAFALHWHAPTPIGWLCLIIAFAIGFFWQLRRFKRLSTYKRERDEILTKD